MRKRIPVSSSDVLNDQIADEKQAAEWMGVTLRTLRESRYDGTGPAYVLIGRKVLYRRSTIMKWMAEQETQPRERAWKKRERDSKKRAKKATAPPAPSAPEIEAHT